MYTSRPHCSAVAHEAAVAVWPKHSCYDIHPLERILTQRPLHAKLLEMVCLLLTECSSWNVYACCQACMILFHMQ